MGLTNNDIIKKLRVALKLKDTDIVDILKLVDYDITKSELGAFFRNEDHPKFKPLQDQILRNFLNGLIVKHRGTRDERAKEKAIQGLHKKEMEKKKEKKKYYPKKKR